MMTDSNSYGEASAEFQQCWTLAASYIQRMGDRDLTWFKGSLYPPFFEHFSFRLGNQLFFVRLEDVEGRLRAPGSMDSLLETAKACRGHPLIMPMKNIGGLWLPIVPGWGLLDALSKAPVDPRSLLDLELVEMTPWELQDLAVHSVLLTLGPRRVLSFTSCPDASPSIWYEGETGVEWIVVRWARWPDSFCPPPANWTEILKASEGRGLGAGFFAVAVFAGRHPASGLPVGHSPMYRGGDVLVGVGPIRRFAGARALSQAALSARVAL
jgi:hypothetical protein